MCDNENKEEKVVYHMAKVNGVDLFEDDGKDGVEVVNFNGYSFGKAYLKPF